MIVDASRNWYPVSGKTFVVLGLGRSGLSALTWLLRQGAHVLAFDDSPEKREKALQLGAGVLFPEQFSTLKQDFPGIYALVQSPGIPFSHPKPHPLTAAALVQGIPVISDINLFKQSHPKNRLIGVTGTNGKSTTSALIGHILEQCEFEVVVGGNIGIPVLSLPQLSDQGIYVLELSSYQLELSNDLDLDAVVWLNLSEDHLDRHGTMEQYIQAKRRIFSGIGPKIAVVGVDDPDSLAVFENLKQTRAIPVSIDRVVEEGIYVSDSSLIDECNGPAAQFIVDCRDLTTLLGRHNWQNVAMAYAFSRAWGCSVEGIVNALKTFPGLLHRQELIATIDQVRFINDSKATNADAVSKALATFDDIYWIAGGQPKQDGIGSLAPFFPKIKHAFLIGQAQDMFSQTLKGSVPYQYCVDLEEATREAFKMAKEAGALCSTVLLSPACASYDQFRDFEHRGDVFRDTVLSLRKGIYSV